MSPQTTMKKCTPVYYGSKIMVVLLAALFAPVPLQWPMAGYMTVSLTGVNHSLASPTNTHALSSTKPEARKHLHVDHEIMGNYLMHLVTLQDPPSFQSPRP